MVEPAEHALPVGGVVGSAEQRVARRHHRDHLLRRHQHRTERDQPRGVVEQRLAPRGTLEHGVEERAEVVGPHERAGGERAVEHVTVDVPAGAQPERDLVGDELGLGAGERGEVMGPDALGDGALAIGERHLGQAGAAAHLVQQAEELRARVGAGGHRARDVAGVVIGRRRRARGEDDEAGDDVAEDAAGGKGGQLDPGVGVGGVDIAGHREARQQHGRIDGAAAEAVVAAVVDRLDVIGGVEQLAANDDASVAGGHERERVEVGAPHGHADHDDGVALLLADPDARLQDAAGDRLAVTCSRICAR